MKWRTNFAISIENAMSTKWIVRILAAMAMVAVVHVFMIFLAVPHPAAWYLGAMIYGGLVAVLFSTKSVFDRHGEESSLHSQWC